MKTDEVNHALQMTDVERSEPDLYSDHRGSNGQLTKGNRGGPGRALGTPSKGSHFKQMIDNAIEAAGGQKAIDALAKTDLLAITKIRASMEPKDLNVGGATVNVVNLIMYKEKPPADWKPYGQDDNADEEFTQLGTDD